MSDPFAGLPLLEKRWSRGRERFVAPSIRVNPDRYNVALITARDAREFVCREHYSHVMPAMRLSVGLIRDGQIVGAAVFSHPMQDAVLTKWLGTRDGIELGRFCLKSEEPFNTESWFLSRALRILRVEKPTIRGVVSMADPMERRNSAGILQKRAHFGQIYRAINSVYRGRSSPRALTLAPDGTLISARAISKVRNTERGERYAQRQIEAAGCDPRLAGESGREWLDRIANQFTRQHHTGNLVFTFAL
jgi:hypothetical protein